MPHPPNGLIAGLVLAIVAIAAPALAQDEPRFAVVASLPTPTISFQWEAADRFALRVEGSYSYRDESSDETSPVQITGLGSLQAISTETHSELTSHGASIALVGIFTVRRGDQLRLYVAPRFLVSFTRQRTSSVTTVIGVPAGVSPSLFRGLERNDSSDTSSTSPGAGASFGATVDVLRHLAVFGETGFTLSRTSDDLPPSGIPTISPTRAVESRRTTLNTRAAVGVMVRF